MTYAQHHHASPSLEPLSEKPIELPFSPGEIIAGKYEVGELIGAGGMGYVVEAKHLDLRELVALKFLRREALAHEELVMRFATEARAAVRIKSEYVARVYDVGNLPDGVPFIVMERLIGKDLCQLLHEEGQLPVKLAVEYVMQVCEALAAAHSIGVVHRDIKPENLFLTDRSQGMSIVKVLDFGISKVALTGSAFDHQPLARTMMPMGSPVYMSPEQIRASDEIDARTDIWSLGCVLYELLTGVPAFDAPSLTQLSATILEKDPVPMSTLAPDVPPELEEVVLRCLEKNRDARYRNIAELAIALYAFAPRRARISAERCAMLLQESSHGTLEFELPSVAPPAHPTLRGRMTSPSVPGGPTSTNSPTATLVDDPDIAHPPFVAKKRRLWVGVSLGVAALAGAIFGMTRGSSATPQGSPATAPAAAAAAAPRLGAADRPNVVEPAAAPPVAAAVTPSAAPSNASAQRASVAVPGPRHPIMIKPKHEGARPVKSGDDLDVGF